MANSFRIRTQPDPGNDKAIRVFLDQDFEFLEILSLKILQSQIYTRPCSDYGVVVGRVSVNSGFGLPNAKVSIFIPLSREDAANPIISDLYPYKTVEDTNEDGYRYNLLPYVQQHGGHTPTGTFFDRTDVLIEGTLIQVYDKYYKYTARTNESGDFMIFGVPLGNQTIHMDVDLSDIGQFSLSPQDLIRMNRANDNQVAGTKFKSSTNLAELPQIVSQNRVINVEPLWGQDNVCNIGITRCDFDLTEGLNIKIEPTAIFLGSIFSDTNSMALKSSCKPRFGQGELCKLIAGPGEILAIRQTIQTDINGRPVLETFPLDAGGQIIDESGTWLVDVPMNLDYLITNEFGEQVISDDPSKGIPTKAKYRFKIKWNQSPSLSEDTKRGYFLVPNVREFGWNSNGTVDPFQTPQLSPTYQLANKSYAFSLDWDDYADPQGAIDCIDSFYYMTYNKVYSVSQLIDQHRQGIFPNRFTSVKNILDDTCESENNRFPTNETVFRGDIIYLLFLFAFIVFRPIIYALVIVIHVLYAVIEILKIFFPLIIAYVIYLSINSFIAAAAAYPAVGLIVVNILVGILYIALAIALVFIWIKLLKLKLKPISVPILLYDQCEFCDCDDPDDIDDQSYNASLAGANSGGPTGAPVIPPNASGLEISEFYKNNYFLSLVTSNNSLIAYGDIMSGQKFKYPPTSQPTCESLLPYRTESTDSNGDKFWYVSTSTNLFERINLFNTKAKYFDNFTGLNPGSGGTNRIKVKFQPIINAGLEHYDNIVFIMLTPNSLANVSTGDLITFQDPKMSKDPNLTGATENEFGNNSITGISINSNTTYTLPISYASFTDNNSSSQPKTITVNYTVSGDSETCKFHRFPVDIEYFQVITAMTYSQFSTQKSNALTDSLDRRYLNNDMVFTRAFDNTIGSFLANNQDIVTLNPLTNFEDYQDQVCLFLVRGVDPYSTRQPVQYDLSRIFGYTTYNNIVVNGNYKLNYPIIGTSTGSHQEKILNTRHDLINNDDFDTYSKRNLYFPASNYQPSNFSGFTSNLPSYYSQLDNNISSITTCNNCPYNLSNGSVTGPLGRRLPNGFASGNITFPNPPGVSYGPNSFLSENNNPTTNIGTFGNTLNIGTVYSNNPNTSRNRGYYLNEIVEGGSLFVGKIIYRVTNQGNPEDALSYITSAYVQTTTMNFPQSLSTNRLFVMRSDRLPASTKNPDNCGLDYLLQANPNLGIYKIPDEGVLNIQEQLPFASNSIGIADQTLINSQSMGNDVIDSLNRCKDSVPLLCYQYDSTQNEFFIENPNPCQSSDYDSPVDIWDKGCYKFVTRILLSIPTDFLLLTEWLARINITFGACRNVFSHVFTNNWINGTLYAMAFKNNRIFDSLNQPSSEYCDRLIHLNPINNNFYYRSSPYHSGGTEYFCGDLINYPGRGPQVGNLKYPTTIVDLGPRSAYLQELAMSDDYDGYVIPRTTTTTFGDVTDLLNIFILSRLASSSFVEKIFGGGGANIFSYFDKRWRGAADGDYVQMVSINSQLGVAEFSSENYPSIPNFQDPIFFNGGDAKDGIFGIFFSSDTQVRDYIAPKRTIIVSSGSPTNSCTYSYFNVFTQEVPLYQWEIVPNEDGGVYESIFGSQGNNWWTTPISGNEYFSNPYQQLDRINLNHRYFQTSLGTTNQDYYKGYIWGIDSAGHYTADLSSQNQLLSPGPFRRNTVGAPFYFYFGLKKGSSAWDRFARKWIDFENITD